MKDKKKKTPREPKKSYPQQQIAVPPSDTDPLGSYTGNPVGEDKQPVQDADDL